MLFFLSPPVNKHPFNCSSFFFNRLFNRTVFWSSKTEQKLFPAIFQIFWTRAAIFKSCVLRQRQDYFVIAASQLCPQKVGKVSYEFTRFVIVVEHRRPNNSVAISLVGGDENLRFYGPVGIFFENQVNQQLRVVFIDHKVIMFENYTSV